MLTPIIPRGKSNNIMRRRYNDFFNFDNFFDNFFDSFFGGDFLTTKITTSHLQAPGIAKHDETDLNIRFNVPGYSKDDLELSLEGNTVWVRNKDEKAADKINLYYVMPDNIDLNSITSSCKNGVLMVNAKFEKELPEKSSKRIIKIG